MILYCIEYSKFTSNNSNIKIKREVNRESNLYFSCLHCGFKKFETIDREELLDLRKTSAIYKTMISSCLKCRKNTESKNPRKANTNKRKLILLSNFAVCYSKKSKFIET